ncbi:MAG: hypothetical protein HZC17_05300 [Candidatus Omnitrophica bacterium]|nr:hypothetical protein [Candidatus Omnitrophota bacterium]
MKKRINLFVLMFLITSSTAWAGCCSMSGHSSAGQSTCDTATAGQGEVMDANCPMFADSSSAGRGANVAKIDSEKPGQEHGHAVQGGNLK